MSRVAFVARGEPGEVIANADAELLEQAVINRLRNAVEAVDDAQAPGILMNCSRDGEQIRIEVLDNGSARCFRWCFPRPEPGRC